MLPPVAGCSCIIVELGSASSEHHNILCSACQAPVALLYLQAAGGCVLFGHTLPLAPGRIPEREACFEHNRVQSLASFKGLVKPQPLFC